MGLAFSSFPQLFLPGRSSPRPALLITLQLTYSFPPQTSARLNLFLVSLSNPPNPPPPVLSNRRLIRVQTWGAGVGQPHLHPHLGLEPPTPHKAWRWSCLCTLLLTDRSVSFSLLFTLYCSCFCTGKRCWSAQKSFRSRLAAELCLIIVIIWKQVMGIFPMLI